MEIMEFARMMAHAYVRPSGLVRIVVSNNAIAIAPTMGFAFTKALGENINVHACLDTRGRIVA